MAAQVVASRAVFSSKELVNGLAYDKTNKDCFTQRF
jgi:hypothetical protein